MKRVACGVLVATVLAGAAAPASARDGWSPGAAAAVGVLGGVAIGSAIAANSYYPGKPVYVAPARPVYVAPAYDEECVVERRRVWVRGWGWEVRRRTVCD